jgi:CMP-N,N'-diacetyllegionaminic acid synthase
LTVIDGRSVLAVVPARGGSKGIPLKNLREVGGRSLVARIGDLVHQMPEIDRAVISTDHPHIAEVAKRAGLDAPFKRPEVIAGDRIGDFDVLIHALGATEAIDDRRYDIVVMLQPTSPLRTPEHVLATIRMLIAGGWDSVWTVSATDSKSHPLKQVTLSEKGQLGYYDSRGSKIIARQQLSPVYHRNGIAYAMTRDCLVSQRTIMGRRTGALVIEGEHFSIDTEFDLAMVEWFLAQRAQSEVQ